MVSEPETIGLNAPALSSRDRLLTVVVASAGLFLVALDFSINVSLPTMRDSLGASLISVQGIIIFYHASRSGLAPAAGGLGDAFGLRRVFLWGVVAYTAAVGFIALQDSLGAVVALRVLQGVGAAILFTAGPALVVRAFGPARRGTALGVTLASVSAGQLTATLGGGFLSETIGWEAIFYARVPIGAAVLAAGVFALSRDPASGDRRFDWSGALVLYGALFALVSAISFARLDGLISGVVIGLAVLTALLFAAFRYLQKRVKHPMLPRALWKTPGFTVGGISNLLVFVAAFLTWFLFPFFITDVLGRGTMVVGSMLAVVPRRRVHRWIRRRRLACGPDRRSHGDCSGGGRHGDRAGVDCRPRRGVVPARNSDPHRPGGGRFRVAPGRGVLARHAQSRAGTRRGGIGGAGRGANPRHAAVDYLRDGDIHLA